MRDTAEIDILKSIISEPYQYSPHLQMRKSSQAILAILFLLPARPSPFQSHSQPMQSSIPINLGLVHLQQTKLLQTCHIRKVFISCWDPNDDLPKLEIGNNHTLNHDKFPTEETSMVHSPPSVPRTNAIQNGIFLQRY